jgi:hypothetical protein
LKLPSAVILKASKMVGRFTVLDVDAPVAGRFNAEDQVDCKALAGFCQSKLPWPGKVGREDGVFFTTDAGNQSPLHH